MKRSIFYLFIVIFIYSGCTTKQLHTQNDSLSNEFNQFVSQLPQDSITATYLKRGIIQIKNKNYVDASKTFQEGLRLYPAQSSLHFLNALTYHLQSFQGNVKKLELAKSGYKTALKFDEKNYWAAYFLGHIYYEQKLYDKAQNQFSYTLLYAPNNPLFLRALAGASYYANDTVMSLWAAKKAYTLEPNNKDGLRSLIFAYAASENYEEASKHYEKFKSIANKKEKESFDSFFNARIKERLQSWKVYYASSKNQIFGDSKEFEKTFIPKGAFAPSSYNPELDNEKSITMPKDDTNETVTTHNDDTKLPKMVLVDVVIIGTEEVRSQSKGINLLEGLQTTLSGTLYSYTRTRGDNALKSISYSPMFNFMDLEYNLNIFNDANNKAEVLAKPSLLATQDQPSKFYSGAILHVQLSSNNADGSMEDVPIGIHLEVTPSFYDDKTVGLTVHAQRGFLQSLSENVGFSAYTQTSSVSVDATAILKLGETLILSGLSEVENTKTKSGVPFLQNIPGVQYFFSKDSHSQLKKSILILITPQDARFANERLNQNETGHTALEQKEQSSKQFTQTLKKEHAVQYPENMETIEAYLQDNRFYRQFRAGDVKLDNWNDITTLENALKRSLEFLYY